MNYHTGEIDKILPGDTFALQIQNRSDDRPTVDSTKWLHVTPEQVERIRAIFTDNDDHYEIMSDDVGKSHIRAFGQSWPVANFIGRILPGDVGKLVYLRRPPGGGSRHLQVESDEQRDARVAKAR